MLHISLPFIKLPVHATTFSTLAGRTVLYDTSVPASTTSIRPNGSLLALEAKDPPQSHNPYNHHWL